MSLPTWSKTLWLLFGNLFVMLKCVLDSCMSSSAQVCEDTGDSCGILPTIHTMHTGAVPAAWSHSCPPCTQLRGSERDKLPGCGEALLAVPLHPELSAEGALGRSQGWCHILWDLPSPAKATWASREEGTEPMGTVGSQQGSSHCLSGHENHKGQGTFCLQGRPGEEQPGRGSGRKFHHTKDRTETRVQDIAVNKADSTRGAQMETAHRHLGFSL